MNRYRPFCIKAVKSISRFLLILLLVVTGLAKESVDEKVPPVLAGFKTLSPEKTAEGTLLLFDGISFFGWNASSDQTTRKASEPDPVIAIKNGSLSVQTPFPIKLHTPLFWSRNDKKQALRLVWNGSQPETTLVCSLLDNKGKVIANQRITDRSDSRKNGWTESRISFELSGTEPSATLEILVGQGTTTLSDIEWIVPGNRNLFANEKLDAWNSPADQMKAEIRDHSLYLTGKGRLETKDQFANFVLNCEFKSEVNPEKRRETFCNSGVFFRCIPGSPLDGYECQVNNVPNLEDRGKFLGNDTGSIFRRILARRLTDRDNEWTRLTIMASGLTIRTWVNGIPAVVWTDDRKPNANPRRGSSVIPGTIQLQGHDPWTHVYYRGFSLAD